jgi:polar amino acid transport system substrate-binding protein
MLCAASLSIAHADPSPLRVGATPTAVPFNFLDPATNTLRGAMIDVANAVGKEAGYKTEISPIPFSSLVPALQTNKIDLISSAFANTPQRAQVVDFTQIVVEYGEGLVVPADDKTDYKRLGDLKGKTVGVQIGTLYVDPLKATPGIKAVKIYDTMADLVHDVSLHRLDAAIGDGPVLAYQVHSQGASGVRYVDSYKPSLPTKISLAVRKGDEVHRAQFDAAITKLKADGTIDAILKKWNIAH